MRLLLVAATTGEIQPTMAWLKQNDPDTDVLITGVGIANTVLSLTNKLSSCPFDRVINAGVCGSFNTEIVPGSCVSVARDCFADFGAEDGEELLDAVDLGFSENRWFASSEEIPTPYRPVSGITVNLVSGSSRTISRRFAKYRAETESMEGAAAFFVCGTYHIPCLQLRCVSNLIEIRNKKNWRMPLAVENLNAALQTTLAFLRR